MKIDKTLLLAAVLAAAPFTISAATAQSHHTDTTMQAHDRMMSDRNRTDQRDIRDQDMRDRHHSDMRHRGWRHGHHYGWRHCVTRWHHHHRVRVCR
jgi:Ni/Co efflux regulator RcnB